MDEEANMEMESNSKASIAEGSKLRDLFVKFIGEDFINMSKMILVEEVMPGIVTIIYFS